MPVSSEKREDKLEILVVIQSLKRQLTNHGYLRTRIRSLGKKELRIIHFSSFGQLYR